MDPEDITIAVVGLGYVGLPLAVQLAKHYPLIGYDTNRDKIRQLNDKRDYTGDLETNALQTTTARFTDDERQLKQANIFITAVPTPVNGDKTPDYSYVTGAAELIGSHIQKGSIAVLESTVAPGATEELFGPTIARISGLTCGTDFTLGYSPERINPGDHEHTVDKIVKVVSGQDERTLETLAAVYGAINGGKIHRAPTIKTAEMAKVIENTLRDGIIAYFNEFSRIARTEGIDFNDVLAAARTKWNFPTGFAPGLVGGHCLPEDPFYLLLRALEKGYHSQLILSARRVNDTMHHDIVDSVVKALNHTDHVPRRSALLLMGLTFKENVNDSRHSGASAVIHALREYGISLYGCDPHLDDMRISREFGILPTTVEQLPAHVAGIVHLVNHDAFKQHTLAHLRARCDEKPFLFDLKRAYDKREAGKNGFLYLHL